MSILEKLKSIFTGPQDEVNFSELIILATLGKTLEIDSVDPRSSLVSDYFNRDAQSPMEFRMRNLVPSLKKGLVNLSL